MQHIGTGSHWLESLGSGSRRSWTAVRSLLCAAVKGPLRQVAHFAKASVLGQRCPKKLMRAFG